MPTLARLHWLPVRYRIDYKLGVLAWKATRLHTPAYLAELLVLRTASLSRPLRNNHQLTIPRVSSRSGERAFSYAAVRLWNSLPVSVVTAPSLECFKSRLKTHFYRLAFY